jgi:hypothetical protein
MARAGRPTIGKEKKVRVNVMLNPAQHEYLKAFGGGNVSAALSMIIERSMAWHEKKYGRKQGYRLPLPVARTRSK